jgi:hypothetical protein
MTFLKSLSTLIIGLSVSLTGCSGPDMNLDARGIDDPMYSTMTGTPGGGSGGTNNYNPAYFRELRIIIYGALSSALTGSDEVHDISQAQAAQSFDYHVGGPSTLDYLSRCALSDGDWASTNSYTGYGEGILKNTTEWKSFGLDLEGKEDVYNCLLAHLNPFDEEVPIYLSGRNVEHDTGFDASPYIYEEALWMTEIEVTVSGPQIHLNVWPLADLEMICTAGTPTIDGLTTRVCGSMDAEECGITVHESLSGCDLEKDGHYTCLGRPAIKTRLRAVDMSVMYPNCGEP